MKKDRWWGFLILCPILLLLGNEYSTYLSKTMFSFPRHLLATLFCFITLIIYPLRIFKNKVSRYISLATSILIIVVFTVLTFIKPPVYSTDILSVGSKYSFDDSYKVYLVDSSYGDLSIRYEDGISCFMVHAEFKKAGKTEFVLASPSGEKKKFEIVIKRNKYKVKEIK